MPLIRYFGFVGTGLVLLLVGLSWCFSQPATEPPAGVSNGPIIRMASAEQVPERVVIDTSLPTIMPPPTVLEFAERWPQATAADVVPVPRPTAPAAARDVSKEENIAKAERSKKVAVHRAAPKIKIESSRNDKVPAEPAVIRSSLLDILKERLGQTLFKLN